MINFILTIVLIYVLMSIVTNTLNAYKYHLKLKILEKEEEENKAA